MPANITRTHPRLEAQEEAKLNEVGDRLANMLGMQVDSAYSPDSQGRTRWKTSVGNKTGIGLLRTVESFIAGEIRSLERSA